MVLWVQDIQVGLQMITWFVEDVEYIMTMLQN